MPPSLKADLESEKNQNHEVPEYLLAVDTHASSNDYAKYKSVILLTDSAVVLPNKNDTLKVVPFSNFKQDFEINKASYLGFVAKLTPYMSYAIPVCKLFIAAMLFLLPLLYGAAAFIGYLFYLLIPSVIFLIVARMLSTGMQYSEVYCLSRYGLTLPLILDVFLDISSVNFGFFAVLLIYMTLVLVKLGLSETLPSMS